MNMNNELLTFHPHILQAYSNTLDWLVAKVPDFRKNNARNRVKKLLETPSLESAALQYYVLFPGHFYKIAYAVDTIIGKERLAEWLEYNPQICVIDVGCGAGAATAAFINSLLNLYETKSVNHSIGVNCIGIDLNRGAIALYNQLLTQIKVADHELNIDLQYHLIPHGYLQAITRLQGILNKLRDSWKKPYLGHVIVMQANVVSPFSERFQNTSSEYAELASLGVNLGLLGDYHETFGKEEAKAYKQILEDVAIDHLHVVTVGTDGFEERVQELADAINCEFQSDRHLVEELGSDNYTVSYQLPERCYWIEWKNTYQNSQSCHIDVRTISNNALEDKDWNAIKSTALVFV
jgi:SAM-dependent methyltransferase